MALLSILDVLMKPPKFGSQAFTSRGLFSDSSFMGAATSFSIATRSSFGNGPMQIAYCDAGATLGKDYDAGVQTGKFSSGYLGATLSEDRAKSTRFGNIFEDDELRYKRHTIKLKPFLSLFHWKNLRMTLLRCFWVSYSPILKLIANTEPAEEVHIDLVEPFYRSVTQICRELSVAITKRILEGVVVNYASQRIAWKLLKDVPESAVRKAGRGWPRSTFCFRVCKTTLRGRLLIVVTSWMIQIGIEIYGLFYNMIHDETDAMEQVKIFGLSVYRATVRCIGSLIVASIGAGIGAILLHPSTGQRIGCELGDYASSYIIRFCFGF